MEQGNSEPAATPTPSPQQTQPVGPPETPASSKFSIVRVLVTAGIACCIVVAIAGAYIVYTFVTNIQQASTEITGNCDQIQAGNALARNQLKSQLGQIRINGEASSSVKSYGGSQCLEGSSPVVVTATYLLSAANVADANAIVLASFPNATQQPFSPVSKTVAGENAQLSGLRSSITTRDKTTYSVGYAFAASIPCQLNNQTVSCDLLTNTINTYNLLNQPIISVTIGLSR